ncbi:MAG: hypothetical protein M1817_004098 [Caeruleum heppii]|nr:MAG: hypothetical protein M1817_004098 [Caeruleum heppii]
MTDDPIAALVDAALIEYQARLADPNTTVVEKGEAGYRWQLMRAEYAKRNSSVTPEEWLRRIDARVYQDLHWENVSSIGQAYLKKVEDMLLIGEALKKNPELLKLAWPEEKHKWNQGLWFPDSQSPHLERALARFDSELQTWVATRPITSASLSQSPDQTLRDFIMDVPVPFVMLRLTQPDDLSQPVLRGEAGLQTAEQTLNNNISRQAATRGDRFSTKHQRMYIEGPPPIVIRNSDQVPDLILPVINPDQPLPPLYEPPEQVKYPPDPPPLGGWAKPEGAEMPTHLLVTDMVLTCIPFLGTAYTVGQVLTGYNIFGYRLSPAERAIMGATILIPWALKSAKLGRGLGKAAVGLAEGEQTASKLGTFTRGMSQATKEAATKAAQKTAAKVASVGLKSMDVILRAAAVICSRKGLSAALTAEVKKVLEALVKATPTLAPRMTVASLEFFIKAVQRFPALRRLEGAAIARIIKVANRNNIIGSLLEELFEQMMNAKMLTTTSARVVAKWFCKPGAVIPVGAKLEYLSGRLITDASHRLLTDGIMAVRETVSIGGQLVHKVRIYTVFELKAGLSGVEGLAGRVAKSIDELAPATQKQLTALAKKEYDAALEQASKAGVTLTTTLEEALARVTKDYLDNTSQILKDISRLMPEGGVAKKILIDGVPHEVLLDDALQFIGVGPSDNYVRVVQTAATGAKESLLPAYEKAEQFMRAKGVAFVYWPLEVTRKELEMMTELLYWFVDTLT